MFKAHDNRLSMTLVEFGILVLGAVTVVAAVTGIIAGSVFVISKLF